MILVGAPTFKGLLKKYLRPGGAHLLMCAVPQEFAYHGIRRTRYAGDRYAAPIQTHFFNRPFQVGMRAGWKTSVHSMVYTSFRNGLWRLSKSRLVSGPWPVRIRVIPGKGHIFSTMLLRMSL